MPAPLTDKQRIELALPCNLAFALVVAGCFGPAPGVDAEEGAAEVKATVARLTELLTIACREPTADLPDRKRRQVEARITRIAAVVTRDWDDEPALKIGLALYYVLDDLIGRGDLVLWEGSAMGEAMTILHPMYADGFAEERLAASARKRARQLLDRLRAPPLGLYAYDPQPALA